MKKNQTSHKTLQHHLLHQRYASKASFSLGYILGGLSSASKNSLESWELKEMVLFEIEVLETDLFTVMFSIIPSFRFWSIESKKSIWLLFTFNCMVCTIDSF